MSDNNTIRKSIGYLTNQYAQAGRVEWIGIRSVRKSDLTALSSVKALESIGLEGDHYKSKNGKRQVTLIQYEHINAVASFMGMEKISPGVLRRNLVVKGVNLHALKGKKFKVGEALLEYTGECHPCSRMEEGLGTGGYNSMRGHGGITAKVITSGEIKIGDKVLTDQA